MMPVTLPVPFVNRAARSVQGPVEYVHTFKAVDSPVSQYNSVTDARDVLRSRRLNSRDTCRLGSTGVTLIGRCFEL